MAVQHSAPGTWPHEPAAGPGVAGPRALPEIGAGSPGRAERVLVGAASLALGLGALAALWLLARPLALLLAAVVLADAVEPVVGWLGRWLTRIGAVILVFGGVLALALLAGWLVLPHLVSQTRGVVESAPALWERGQQLLDTWVPTARAYGGPAVQSSLSQSAEQAVTLPLTAASVAFDGLLVVGMAAYWLVALPTLRRFVLSLVPPERVPEVRAVLGEVGQAMGGYVRGTAINAAVVGTLVSIGMAILGVPYPLVFGLLAALGEPFPYVGPIVAALPAVLVSLLESPTQALVVLGFYAFVQVFEGYLLFPLVIGRQTDVPPLLVLIGLLAGGAVGGLLGALVAIPLTAALRVVFLRLVVPALRRRTGGTTEAAEQATG